MNHISNNGFIVLHRKMVDWEWYQDANTMRLFLHCILKANHKTKKWQGIDIQRGQFLTSSDILAGDLKLSRQQIRTSLNKLKSTSEITISTTARNSMITVSAYNDYQDKKPPDNQLSTSYQPASNQIVTTTNNDNNVNKGNKKKTTLFIPPTEEQINNIFIEVGMPQDNGAEARRYIDYYAQQGWKLSNGNKMVDWKAAAKNWLRNQQKWNNQK
jgi:hypothetical protein|tara:strand:- start:1463 stop:2104 length:642 start_codon:yes stop_codon:yes gene_type:complete